MAYGNNRNFRFAPLNWAEASPDPLDHRLSGEWLAMKMQLILADCDLE